MSCEVGGRRREVGNEEKGNPDLAQRLSVRESGQIAAEGEDFASRRRGGKVTRGRVPDSSGGRKSMLQAIATEVAGWTENYLSSKGQGGGGKGLPANSSIILCYRKREWLWQE